MLRSSTELSNPLSTYGAIAARRRRTARARRRRYRDDRKPVRLEGRGSVHRRAPARPRDDSERPQYRTPENRCDQVVRSLPLPLPPSEISQVVVEERRMFAGWQLIVRDTQTL